MGRHDGVTVAVLGNSAASRDPRRRPPSATRSSRGCARARSPRRGTSATGAGRGAGRRRPGRPRADLGGRTQGADGGRRRRRRPAGAARAARRAAAPTSSWSTSPSCPRGRSAHAGGDQPGHRGPRPGRQAGGRGSRAATASCSAAATRRSRPARPPAYRSPWSRGSPARSPYRPLAGIPVTHRGVAHDFTVISGHLPPGPRRLAGRLGRPGRLRGTLRAHDGRRERARDRRGAGRGRHGPRHPGRGGLRRHACRGSAPSSAPSAASATTSTAHEVRPPAIIVVGDVVAVAHPEHFGPLA